ncbi:hypothetical protein ACWOC1_05065 [Enterococcus quebecensis]|uniref:Uncharacterized protein n=1 Tax=Enterococcus quebecensis TaxID=903983 RepID=A0A1E5GWC8_9ENTE|nr:hypothetical protein [Enterococcus quebecensis]OEG17008.1 hypothetical protein BCR23_03085 [Enterococcus quebecensis]OJG75378.1 hypothetical protein RV12_GL001181 [Enterococcus quebecensis]
MKKRGRKNNFKKNGKLLFLLVVIFVIVGYFFMSRDKMKASTVISSGDFRLTAENKWSNEDKKNYAALEWDKIADLSQLGYRLYQSEDGTSWSNRSLNYGKAIKVLNIYPDEAQSNTLKGWMDGLNLKTDKGENLIQVTPVTFNQYNANPNAYLKNSAGEYQYDVLMVGSWDANNGRDFSQGAANATKLFLDTGRGSLFGHDTVIQQRPVLYSHFGDRLSVGNNKSVTQRTGAVQVKLINNGYLMKYPFEMQNDVVLTIPYTHNIELQKKDTGITWLEFVNPSGSWPNPIFDDGVWRGGWYLKTNNNVGMIQTGHSNGQSTMDERKIIANTLYNLAQVSSENFASDQTVKDDQAPNKPIASIRCDKEKQLSVKLDASDNGKEYQWYIEANTKSGGVKKSDVVKEPIISNIAGYFYELTDSPKSDLKKTVESYKDSYGRIDPGKYNLYVAPDDDSVKYETRSAFTINENRNSGKYLHVLAVDRSNNVSQVSSQQIKDLPQNVDFKTERTKNEVKLIDLHLDSSLNNKIEELEIRVATNTVIKDFSSLKLPAGWSSRENKETAEYKTFTFVIKNKNDLVTITNFINTLRFSIHSPTDQEGEVQMIFYEKVPDASVPNEVTNVCWTAQIPQKVSLKAYDESGNRLPSGDLLLDQKLTIGKKEMIKPLDIDFYDFIRLVSTNGSQISPLEWTITNALQVGHLIYSQRKLTVHVRQVVLNKNDQVVLPKNGFGFLGSKTVLGQEKDKFSLTMVSSADNAVAFNTYIIRYQSSEPMYTFTPQIPMNYELVGYVLTMNNQLHSPNASSLNPIQVDVTSNSEFWLTTYIKPGTEKPTFYHWEYKENNLGTINVK